MIDFDTTLRCLGYAIDFIFATAPLLGLGLLAWRVAR
jgi:hypothetical protein